MEKLYLYIGILFVLGFLFRLFFKKKPKEKNIYQYTKKPYLLRKDENDFLKILEQILSNRYYIFPQVHISSIVEHKIKGQSFKGALSHIDRKSIDYLVCDKQYISPILGIELDGSSHDREDRIERDIEVERIFKDIDLPLLRINSKDRNNTEFIKGEIEKFVPNIKQFH